MDLNKYLSKVGKTTADIQRIYHGLNRCCRCGCGGKYFERGSAGFTRAMNKMQNKSFEPLAEGDLVHMPNGQTYKSEGIDIDKVYVNIPYNAENDKCYCIYFKN